MAAGADVDKRIHGVAVFDFDGTLINGQSGTLFTRYLRSNGMMSPGSLARLAWWGIRYKLHAPFKQEEARELVLSHVSLMPTERVSVLEVVGRVAAGPLAAARITVRTARAIVEVRCSMT